MQINNKTKSLTGGKKLIILDTFYDYFLANIARHKLNGNGIKCYVEENHQTNSPGSIELKVYSSDLRKAFKILSE